MPIFELQARLSHREFLLWKQWLQNKWNEPSRTDYYLMQLTKAVLGSNAPIDRFKIKFAPVLSDSKQNSESIWLTALGVSKDGIRAGSPKAGG